MLKLFSIDLRLFDGGAAAAGADGAGSAAQAESTTTPDSSQRGQKTKAGETQVIYGKQPEDTTPADAGQTKTADTTATSDTLEARRAEFERLIGEEYKDIFSERVQAIINRRFRETKALEGYRESTEPLLALLQQRHGESDPARLMAAIEADESFWEDAAAKAGMSVEAYRTLQKTKAENEMLLSERRRASEDYQMRQQIESWRQQEQALKATYPNFSLESEMQNPEFSKMVRGGTPVQAAFYAMHHDELMSGAMQQAAARTEQAVVSNIRAKGQRPVENGASPQPGVIVKSDVHSLTRKDRAEIARRAARGDKIEF